MKVEVYKWLQIGLMISWGQRVDTSPYISIDVPFLCFIVVFPRIDKSKPKV